MISANFCRASGQKVQSQVIQTRTVMKINVFHQKTSIRTAYVHLEKFGQPPYKKPKIRTVYVYKKEPTVMHKRITYSLRTFAYSIRKCLSIQKIEIRTVYVSTFMH